MWNAQSYWILEATRDYPGRPTRKEMAQTGVFRKMRAEGGPAREADLERLCSMVGHHTEGRATTYATLPEAQLHVLHWPWHPRRKGSSLEAWCPATL